MNKCLVDAGPLIALFDASDNYHESVKESLKHFQGVLITTLPVVTEVLHMLNFNVIAQLNFLKWIDRGGLEIKQISKSHLSKIIELTKKYANIPMDFADASLIITSEIEHINEIITIDSDFYIYRNVRNEYISNIFIPEIIYKK
jgi:uncharacterized protein